MKQQNLQQNNPRISALDRRNALRAALAGVMLIGALDIGGHRASAVTNNWVRAGGSTSWFVPANWSDGVPAPDDEVYMLSNSVAFVQGPTEATAANLHIDTGGVTVGDIDSGTLIVSGQIAVGAAGSPGSFTLNYGRVSANAFAIGSGGSYSDTSEGVIVLTGPDASWRMAGGVTAVVNSRITGTNGLIKGGLGTLVLAGDNTYSGGTTISNGTLQVGNGGSTGTLGDGEVRNYSTLIFNRNNTYSVTNLISGTGRVVQRGSGTTIILADNTYSGGTTISNGTIQVGNGGTTGALGSGDIVNYGKLVFNRGDAVEVTNLISGSGSLSQIGSSTLTLTANNTYTGTTTIGTNSALQIGNGGTTGMFGSGAVTNNGLLIFNRSDELVVSNLISGAGSLTQAGSGTTVLTANNTYSGSTTISNGTLQIGNGGNTGAIGTNAVLNFGALVFNRTNDLRFDNMVSGTGSLSQNGSGTLTLTASNSYSGGTWIRNGGTLAVQNGSALGSGDLNVVDGTFRVGAGRSNLVVNIGGNYTQSADGTLELRIGGSASTNYDQLRIAGTATLDGTLRLVATNNYVPYHNDTLTLLTATGGVVNTFATFSNTINHSPLLSPQLTYGPTMVSLEWEQLSFVDFLTSSNVALTPNQKAVATGLDSIISSTHSNDVALIKHLDYLPNLTADLPVAFDQIAPDELTSMLVASFAGMDLQGDQTLRRTRELQMNYRKLYSDTLGARARQPDAFNKFVSKPWNTYLEFPLNSVTVEGDANAAGYDLTAMGVTFGGDRRLNDNLFAGAAVSYLLVNGDFDQGGELDLNTVCGQLYATWFKGGLHFEAMVGGAYNSYDTTRKAIGGEAEGDATGYGWTGLVGGGYDWTSGPWKFGPQASVQYMSASIDEFTEEGSLAPMRIKSQSEDALHSQLSLNLRYRHYINDSWTFITPELFVAWRHEFIADNVSLESQFASGEGQVFSVTGPDMGSDSVIVGLGCSIQWKPSFNTYVNFAAQMGRTGYDSQSINLGLRYSF